MVYYNFGDAGREEKNNQVAGESYTGQIVPSAFLLDDETSVLVGESGFYIYEGTDKPKLKKKVKFRYRDQECISYREVYRFVLKVKGQKRDMKSVFIIKKEQRTMSKKFQGDYAHVKMVGETVMMYDGVNCCIYTANGVKRFAGQFQDKILDIVPVGGSQHLYGHEYQRNPESSSGKIEGEKRNGSDKLDGSHCYGNFCDQYLQWLSKRVFQALCFFCCDNFYGDTGEYPYATCRGSNHEVDVCG